MKSLDQPEFPAHQFLIQSGFARDEAMTIQTRPATSTAVPIKSQFLSYTGHIEAGFIRGSNETIHVDQWVWACMCMLGMLQELL